MTLWMLVALITINNVIGEKIITQNTVAVPIIEEGTTLPNGQIILLVDRADLDLATAIIESEKKCRAELASCAAQSPPKAPFPWAWITSTAAVAFLAGLAAGHFL